ncbi:LolA family protein [Agromyces sp. NPDC004153]
MRPRDTGASRRFARWIPAIAAPIVVGVAVVLVPLQANAAVDLPDLTPEELLELAASSDVEALSGTVEQTSELGLPDLSGLTGGMSGSASATPGSGDGSDTEGGDAASGDGIDEILSLITGNHTAKVYVDGSNARLQVLDRLGERDVYVTAGEGAWIWDSREQSATHVTVDQAALEALEAEAESHADEARAKVEAEYGTLPTPEQVLDDALAKLDETTDVSVGTDARVAGREAYELVLVPRDDATLVGEVSVAIDADTGVALAASVTAAGAEEPAFRVAFTDVSFEAPDASVFAFTPPDGATVTEHEVPVPTVAELEQWKAEAESGAAAEAEGMPRPIVHGSGWSTVVELPAGAGGAAEGAAGAAEGAEGAEDFADASTLLDSIAQRVDGGRIVSTSLVTVLFTDDGRVFAGAVTPEHLLAVASSAR